MRKFVKPTLGRDGKPRVIKLPNGTVIPKKGADVVWDAYMRRRLAEGSVEISVPVAKPIRKEKPAAEKSAVKTDIKPAKKTANNNEVD